VMTIPHLALWATWAKKTEKIYYILYFLTLSYCPLNITIDDFFLLLAYILKTILNGEKLSITEIILKKTTPLGHICIILILVTDCLKVKS
jgi:hypothetical protein